MPELDYTIAPSPGYHLIFITEERPVIGRQSVWLSAHDTDAYGGQLDRLTERDLSVLGAFIDQAGARLSREKTRRAQDRRTTVHPDADQ